MFVSVNFYFWVSLLQCLSPRIFLYLTLSSFQLAGQFIGICRRKANHRITAFLNSAVLARNMFCNSVCFIYFVVLCFITWPSLFYTNKCSTQPKELVINPFNIGDSTMNEALGSLLTNIGKQEKQYLTTFNLLHFLLI